MKALFYAGLQGGVRTPAGSAPQGTVGLAAKPKAGHWVQTERKAHEAWANLISRKPSAAMLLHHLVAQMGHQNAVVIGQKTLAKLLGIHERTVRRAVADLAEELAWGQSRDQLKLSVFSATVVADFGDQKAGILEHSNLRRIPTLFPGERQLPTGPGEDPPCQLSIVDIIEPDLPYINKETGEVNSEMKARYELEKLGQLRIPD